MKKVLITVFAIVMAIAMTACGTQSSDLPDLSGTFQDENSGRAALSLEKTEGDNYDILIEWAQSASEQYEWRASGTFDGDKIEYTNGEKHLYEYGENGDVLKNEVVAENQKGVITVGEGLSITWQGEEEDEQASFIQVSL